VNRSFNEEKRSDSSARSSPPRTAVCFKSWNKRRNYPLPIATLNYQLERLPHARVKKGALGKMNKWKFLPLARHTLSCLATGAFSFEFSDSDHLNQWVLSRHLCQLKEKSLSFSSNFYRYRYRFKNLKNDWSKNRQWYFLNYRYQFWRWRNDHRFTTLFQSSGVNCPWFLVHNAKCWFWHGSFGGNPCLKWSPSLIFQKYKMYSLEEF
jgi:hypothetical protein